MEKLDRLLTLFWFIYHRVLSCLDIIVRLKKVRWPQRMEVAVRSEKADMDGRNQGWAIFNKYYKTGILSKAIIRFRFV
jgi:hypothetical protein